MKKRRRGVTYICILIYTYCDRKGMGHHTYVSYGFKKVSPQTSNRKSVRLFRMQSYIRRHGSKTGSRLQAASMIFISMQYQKYDTARLCTVCHMKRGPLFDTVEYQASSVPQSLELSPPPTCVSESSNNSFGLASVSRGLSQSAQKHGSKNDCLPGRDTWRGLPMRWNEDSSVALCAIIGPP